MRKVALTIAGSDSSGGAGIQADLKTMTSLGVYGMSAITALTAQNTLGVYEIEKVSPSFLHRQLESIFSDIYPHGIKIGMVASKELIGVIEEYLRAFKNKNIVLDPVLASTSQSKLLEVDAMKDLKEKLFPLAKLITPNIPEASLLTGVEIISDEDVEKAAKMLFSEYGSPVLIKGGHKEKDANDFLFSSKGGQWYSQERIANSNSHGSGCSLSSAIVSFLVQDYSLEQSIEKAKNYISGALRANLDLGQGQGPLDHMWNLEWREK